MQIFKDLIIVYKVSELDVRWSGMAGSSKEGVLSEAQIREGRKCRAVPVAPLASTF